MSCLNWQIHVFNRCSSVVAHFLVLTCFFGKQNRNLDGLAMGHQAQPACRIMPSLQNKRWWLIHLVNESRLVPFESTHQTLGCCENLASGFVMITPHLPVVFSPRVKDTPIVEFAQQAFWRLNSHYFWGAQGYTPTPDHHRPVFPVILLPLIGFAMYVRAISTPSCSISKGPVSVEIEYQVMEQKIESQRPEGSTSAWRKANLLCWVWCDGH